MHEVCYYIQAGITNYDDLYIAMKGMDVVFHVAAIIPAVMGAPNRDFDDVNLKGTENVITTCKEQKVKRLIYTSSMEFVQGKCLIEVDIIDENYPFPKDSLDAYVRPKREAERLFLLQTIRKV